MRSEKAKAINGRKEHPYAAPTYKDSPNLQEIASLSYPGRIRSQKPWRAPLQCCSF